MHIGRLSAKLTPGVFVIEDLLIEGLSPQDRPFLKAKKIEVRVPWWTVFTRKLLIESVALTDWDMVVESWPGGRHSFPKVTPRNPRKGPSRFTTTLKLVSASNGQFTYDDHATPWSTVARNLTMQLYRSEATKNYRGSVKITNGTVKIQSYESFRMDMDGEFSLDGGKVHFDRMDLLSDGARTAAIGDVDLGKWPEQTYQLRSRIDFPRQKDIFFHGQKFDASGVGDFTGTFHLFKGGRELKGTFRQPAGWRERLALSESSRLGLVAAGSSRNHQRDERALWRQRALRLPHGAVRPADAGARDMGRRIQGRRPRQAHGLSGNAGPAPVRTRQRAKSTRVAAGEMVRAYRQWRGHRFGARRSILDDARTAR